MASADPFALFGGGGGGGGAGAAAAPTLRVVLPASQGKGLEVSTAITRAPGGGYLYTLRFTNQAGVPLDGIMIQLNKNALGLVPSAPLSASAVGPGQSVVATCPLTQGPPQPQNPPSLLQVAVVRACVGLCSLSIWLSIWPGLLPPLSCLCPRSLS